ncbi:MAG: HIT family protein [Zoogloeaceae bacterium]|nr:HIT family protein [Rhodocyclaceae bacterium]MCP5234252.1 HIT family protein [Zoogloeaceae bacterium]
MAYDRNNVFARILRGELPCIKVYEDPATLAFLDIMPQSDGHTLVLPKEPAVTLLDLSPEAASACILTTKRVAAAVRRAVGAPGLLISQFNGEAAGQTVAHVHFHIIPRFPGLKLKAHAREKGDPDRLEQIAARIMGELDAQRG